MRSLRKFLSRIVLLALALTLSANLLPTFQPSAGAVTVESLLKHKGGLLLDGEGWLPDLGTTPQEIRPAVPLHESLTAAGLINGNAGPTLALGAPAIPGTLVLGNGEDIIDNTVDSVKGAAQSIWDSPLGDGAKWLVNGAGELVTDAGKVISPNVPDWLKEDLKSGVKFTKDAAGYVYDANKRAVGILIDGTVQIWNTVNPGCNPFNSDTYKQCMKNAVGRATCLTLPTIVITMFVAKDWGCVDFLKRVLKAIAAWLLSEVLQRMIYQLNETLRDDVINMTNYTLVEMLGKNRIGPFNFAPVIDCNLVPGSPNAAAYGVVGSANADGTPNDAAATCRSSQGDSSKYWFTGQYRLMRMIGIFLIVPLLIMVAIMSIIRGSLFFLLRAFLIMLPLASIGSVLLFSASQMLMNVADDMALYLANATTSPASFGMKFNEAVGQLDAKSFGLFTTFWFIVLILSMIVIMAELMLRQMGIYLTLIFIPLAFATLVYPPLVRWLKRGFSLLLGLIFMKVFIVAVLSMGFAAMASTVQPTGDKSDPTIIINQCILAVIVLFFAGFGGTKILAFTPAADAVANRLANPQEVLGMGDFTAQQLGKYGGQVMERVGGAAQGGGGVGGGVGSGDSTAGTPQSKDPQVGSGDGTATQDTAAPPPKSGGNHDGDDAKGGAGPQQGQGGSPVSNVADAAGDAVGAGAGAASGSGDGGGTPKDSSSKNSGGGRHASGEESSGSGNGGRHRAQENQPTQKNERGDNGDKGNNGSKGTLYQSHNSDEGAVRNGGHTQYRNRDATPPPPHNGGGNG